MVEIWKHALIVDDVSMSSKISKCLRGKILSGTFFELIKFSLKTKKRFVEIDYGDRKGMHKALSLGHTFANYLESRFKFRHGQAVFYGIILEVILSVQFGTIKQDKFNSIQQLISLFEKKIALLHVVQNRINIDEVINDLKFDKINHGGCFTFVLLTNKGFCVKSTITDIDFRKALTTLINFIVL